MWVPPGRGVAATAGARRSAKGDEVGAGHDVGRQRSEDREVVVVRNGRCLALAAAAIGDRYDRRRRVRWILGWMVRTRESVAKLCGAPVYGRKKSEKNRVGVELWPCPLWSLIKTTK